MILKLIFTVLLCVHGLIHVLGFVKSKNPNAVPGLKLSVSGSLGLAWLMASLLFGASVVMMWLGRHQWWMIATPALVLSQVLIIIAWKEARFGTLLNLVILTGCVISYSQWSFRNTYLRDVVRSRAEALSADEDPRSLDSLPPLIENYIRQSGCEATGEEYRGIDIIMKGQLRERNGDWMQTNTEQFNRLDRPGRYFFLEATMFGLPVVGYHRFEDGKATMDIRLAGLIPVSYQEGPLMDSSEMVTWFNELALMSPRSLTHPDIQWEQVSPKEVVAIFDYQGIQIESRMQFDTNGKLMNYLSPDRYVVSEEKKYPFTTPVLEYGTFGSCQLPKRIAAEWIYPDKVFRYAEFDITGIKPSP